MDYINGFLSLIGLLLGFSLASLVTVYFSEENNCFIKTYLDCETCPLYQSEKSNLELPTNSVKQVVTIAFSFFNIALLILFLIVLLYTFPLSKHPILIASIILIISAFTSFISIYFLVLQLSTNKGKSLITTVILSGILTAIIFAVLIKILSLR